MKAPPTSRWILCVAVLLAGPALSTDVRAQCDDLVIGTPGDAESGAEAGDRFGGSVASGDFDGDLAADVAIGVPGEGISGMAEAGLVNVLYGSREGGISGSGAQGWNQGSDGIAGSPEAGDDFGSALAVGDFDQDGHDDLVIGAWGEDLDTRADAGQVSVLYGGASGLTAGTHEVWTQQVLGDDLGTDQFGRALATGGFNHDGYDDLAVGSPREDVELVDGPTYADPGSTWILYGSAAGLRSTGALELDRGIEAVDGVPRDGDHFGEALGVGDFDCNGADDLAIGVPGDDIGYIDGGSVNLIYGIPVIGLFPIGDQLFVQGTAGMNGSAGTFEELGYAVAGVPELWWIFTDGFEGGDTDRWSEAQGLAR